MTIHRIAVAGRKGGVGKTTIACGLASIFAHQRKRVLIIDLDPQSNVAFGFGLNLSAPGTAQFLTGDPPTGEKASDFIVVYPGGTSLERNDVMDLPRNTLAYKVEELSDFDVIIYDCPPGISAMEDLAMSAANTALIVTDAHPYSLLGAIRIQNQLSNDIQNGLCHVTRKAVVLSKINKTRSIDRAVPETIPKHFPNTPYVSIPQDAGLYNATASQTNIMEHTPQSKGVQSLIKLVKWITNG